MNQRPPILQAYVINRMRNGVWSIGVQCPYCSREHRHGGGSGDAPLLDGLRSQHCTDDIPECADMPGYELAPADSETDFHAEWKYALELMATAREEREHQRTRDIENALLGHIGTLGERISELESEPRPGSRQTRKQRLEEELRLRKQQREARAAAAEGR